MWLTVLPFGPWKVSIVGATLVTAAGAVADNAVVSAIIGGVFLILSGLLNVWFVHRIDKRDRQDRASRAGRRAGGRGDGRRGRSASGVEHPKRKG